MSHICDHLGHVKSPCIYSQVSSRRSVRNRGARMAKWKISKQVNETSWVGVKTKRLISKQGSMKEAYGETNRHG